MSFRNGWQIPRDAWRRISRSLLLRGRIFGAGTPPEWIEEVQRVVSDLEQMNRSTEADFLVIGEKLTGFLSAARTISAGARSLAESVTGKTGDSACRALLTVLDKAREMQKQANAAGGLVRMRDSLAGIRRALAGCKRVGSSFQVMATLAQIETAHLGAAGLDLGHLADEFRTAGEAIRSRVEEVLEGAAALGVRIDSALRDASAFDERSLQELPSLFETAGRGLEEFRGRQEQSRIRAAHLESESAVFGKAIADIVASIQFHDITRQQVEHVLESLKRLVAETPPGRGAPSGPPAEAGAVIALQSAQLDHAVAVFAEALHQMDRQLETIAGQINAMLGEEGGLAGSPDSDKASFYSEMESSFRSIAETAAGCASLEQRTRDALLDLRQTLESLRSSTVEIHTVELKLRWLAINAGISAAHIGAAGEPLEAVAAAMHQLVAECEAASGEADASIDSIMGTVGAAIAAAADEETGAGERLFDQLREQIRELHGLHEGSEHRTRELASIASALSAEVEELRRGISAGRVFTSTIDACRGVLRGVSERAGEAGHRHELLNDFGHHYTMHAEREVHAAVAAGTAPPAATAEPAPSEEWPAQQELAACAAPPSSGEFGDNVELF